MILVIIRMKVLAEKRKELSQTIASLIGSLRTEKGAGAATFAREGERFGKEVVSRPRKILPNLRNLFAPGGHSLPSLKARSFLADLIRPK